MCGRTNLEFRKRIELVTTETFIEPSVVGQALDELASVIAEIAHQEDERAKATVRELLDKQLTLTRDESTAGLSIGTVHRTGDPRRRADRLRLAAGDQEVARRQQVADGPAVCHLRGESGKCDAPGPSNRAGGVLFARTNLVVHGRFDQAT